MVTRAEKEVIVNEFKDAFTTSPLLVFTDFKGMPVAHTDELRMELFKAYGERAVYQVTRNSLLKTALKQAELNLEEYEHFLEYNTGVLYIKEGDPVEALKILTEFSKKHKDLPAIKGGVFEGKIFDAEQAKELAKLPSKQDLIAMFLNVLNAPIAGFVNVLAGTVKKPLYVLNAIKDKKSEQ